MELGVNIFEAELELQMFGGESTDMATDMATDMRMQRFEGESEIQMSEGESEIQMFEGESEMQMFKGESMEHIIEDLSGRPLLLRSRPVLRGGAGEFASWTCS
jgi:hypothetical protein